MVFIRTTRGSIVGYRGIGTNGNPENKIEIGCGQFYAHIMPIGSLAPSEQPLTG
jgi:hypothetical protein